MNDQERLEFRFTWINPYYYYFYYYFYYRIICNEKSIITKPFRQEPSSFQMRIYLLNVIVMLASSLLKLLLTKQKSRTITFVCLFVVKEKKRRKGIKKIQNEKELLFLRSVYNH